MTDRGDKDIEMKRTLLVFSALTAFVAPAIAPAVAQQDQLEVRSPLDPLADLKARSSGFAINEYFGQHNLCVPDSGQNKTGAPFPKRPPE